MPEIIGSFPTSNIPLDTPNNSTNFLFHFSSLSVHIITISHAYETLSDPESREMYDRYGEDGPSGGGGFGFGGMSQEEMFAQMFGGGGGFFGGMGDDGHSHHGPGGGRSRTRRGEDISHNLNVTLEDLYNGKTTRMSLQKNVVCGLCDG